MGPAASPDDRLKKEIIRRDMVPPNEVPEDGEHTRRRSSISLAQDVVFRANIKTLTERERAHSTEMKDAAVDLADLKGMRPCRRQPEAAMPCVAQPQCRQTSG